MILFCCLKKHFTINGNIYKNIFLFEYSDGFKLFDKSFILVVFLKLMASDQFNRIFGIEQYS